MTVNQKTEQEQVGLAHYWALVVRRRWKIGGAAVSLWALALLASLVLPAKYKSETTILIEQPRVPVQYVTPNVTVNLQEQLQSLTEQILSRTRLVRIMDRFHLYGKQPDQPATDAMLERMRKDITIDLMTAPGHTDQLSAFKISYSAPSATLAQQVAGQLTSLFIDENLRTQQQLSQDTTAFLDHQLQDARKDLEQQEKALGEFRSKYLGELPEQLQGNVQILGGLQSRLQTETEALNQAEQQRLYLTSLVGQSKTANSKGSDDVAIATPMAVDLDAKLDKMKSDLAILSTRYTPQHPDVLRLKAQIANLEKLKDGEAKGGKGSLGASPSQAAVISPIAQLESQLKANELEIVNRKREISGLEAQIDGYQGRLNLTPIREQQLADVARNYDQSRTNYESLLAKKLQSQMATDLEERQQGEQFRIIDPPNLPQKPYWPNRLLFGLAGLLGGAALGMVSCIIAEMMNGHIYGEAELQSLAPLPILVTIPPLLTVTEKQQREQRFHWELIAASVLTVAIPVITLLIGLKG